MAKAKSPSRTQGRASPAPAAFIEYAPLITALVAGGKASFDIAGTVAEKLQQGKTPLSIQVLQSLRDGDDYLLLVRLTSFSGHGLCINAVASKFPSKVQPGVERDQLGYDEDPTPRRKIAVPARPPLPFRLPPLESQDLRLRLNIAATQAQIYNHRHAKLVVNYEVLGMLDAQELALQVRLRDDVPITGRFMTDHLWG